MISTIQTQREKSNMKHYCKVLQSWLIEANVLRMCAGVCVEEVTYTL